MELRHLRYVVAVADAGSLVAAARCLRVAQQSLSAQVADLERELGAALFVRHPRGMALTAAGAEFLAYAREALAANARAVEHVRRAGAGRPALRVGLFDYGAGQQLALRAVAAFRAAHPHAALELSPLPTARQPQAVAAERLDVGFALGYAPEGGDLAALRLSADPVSHVLLPSAHPLAARPAVAAADLSRLPALSYSEDAHPRLIEEDAARMRAAGWTRRYAVEVEYGPQLLPMVAAGAGWVTIPASFAPHAPAGTACRPLASGGGAPMDVYALTRAGAAERDDPLAAAFLTCLCKARDEPAVNAGGAGIC